MILTSVDGLNTTTKWWKSCKCNVRNGTGGFIASGADLDVKTGAGLSMSGPPVMPVMPLIIAPLRVAAVMQGIPAQGPLMVPVALGLGGR